MLPAIFNNQSPLDRDGAEKAIIGPLTFLRDRFSCPLSRQTLSGNHLFRDGYTGCSSSASLSECIHMLGSRILRDLEMHHRRSVYVCPRMYVNPQDKMRDYWVGHPIRPLPLVSERPTQPYSLSPRQNGGKIDFKRRLGVGVCSSCFRRWLGSLTSAPRLFQGADKWLG